jgi:hypothetical protein
MRLTEQQGGDGAFEALRRFARPRAPLERCDLCGLAIAPDHDHLLEPAARRLVCTCGACAVLFSGQADTRYKRVPRRVRLLERFALTEAQWEDLRLPIDLAFFFHSTPHGKMMACYPSPAGATESLLDLDAWDDLQRNNPVLAELAPDVEALLVNRVTRGRGSEARPPAYFLAPMDQCFRLVGLIRAHWRGFTGGSVVWEEIDGFFADLTRRARPAVEARHA